MNLPKDAIEAAGKVRREILPAASSIPLAYPHSRGAFMEEMRDVAEFQRLFSLQRTRLLGEVIRALMEDLDEEIE